MANLEIRNFVRKDYIKFKYTWTIHNISKRSEESTDCIFSPLFPEEVNSDGLQWQLRLYPSGVNLKFEDYVSLYVKLHSDLKNISDIPGNIRLKICNFPSKDTPISKHRLDDPNENPVVGFDNFIKRDVLLNALIDDKLIIFCEISTMGDLYKDATYRSNLEKDFDSLFEDQDFSDVTVVVGKRKLKAHKAILGARSPVFKAMFNYNMKENLDNVVYIQDLKYEVVKELLRYIYTNRIQNLEKVKLGLLFAADKYQLEELKAICERALLTVDISAQNFFEMYIIAEKYRAHMLKVVILNYIRKHSRSIVTTPGWKKLMEEYPDLVEEAFCVLSEKSHVITSLK